MDVGLPRPHAYHARSVIAGKGISLWLKPSATGTREAETNCAARFLLSNGSENLSEENNRIINTHYINALLER